MVIARWTATDRHHEIGRLPLDQLGIGGMGDRKYVKRYGAVGGVIILECVLCSFVGDKALEPNRIGAVWLTDAATDGHHARPPTLTVARA